MDERLIQKALFNKFSHHKYMFANTFFFRNESDFLSFLQNGLCYEFEIKISRSDFKADFKKEKHRIHQSNETKSSSFLRKIREVYAYHPSWELCREYPELIESRENFGGSYRTPESTIFLTMHIASEIEFIDRRYDHLPNKFFYVVPAGLITNEEIPQYAGLIYINDDFSVKKIKDGKFLHKNKLDINRLFNKTYAAYFETLREKLNINQNTF